MKLTRLTTLKELATFTPKLLELHEMLEGKWEPDLSAHEFLGALIDNLSKNSFYFGEFAGHELVYFAALLKQDETKGMFWLFYMNKDFRSQTKQLLELLKDFMRSQGFLTIYSQSTRTSSSYERWLEKFGAEKVAIVYKFNL